MWSSSTHSVTTRVSSGLNNPKGVAVDSYGNIYIADSGNNRIRKFDSAGTYLAQFGSFGSGDGKFNAPRGIAFDSAGNYFVARLRQQPDPDSLIQAGTYLAQFGIRGVW